MAKIIAFSNQKGGGGKSTTCACLATCFANKGLRTLVVDFDPTASLTTMLGGRVTGGTAYDVVIKKRTAKECVTKTYTENLYLLPSGIDLVGAEIELSYRTGRESTLKQAIDCIRDSYDYILIDCPPSLGLLTLNALVAADEVIIPLVSEYLAVSGLSNLLCTINAVKAQFNPGLELRGILLTMFDGRALVSRQIHSQLSERFEGLVFNTKIPRSVRVAEAPSYGKSAVEYDPQSTASTAYAALAEEYLNNN